MGRRKLGARVNGPYLRGDGDWIVRVFDGTGESSDSRFEKQDQAEKFAAICRAEVGDAVSTVAQALGRYEQYLIDEGNKPGSYKETLRRIRLFVGDTKVSFGMLSPKWGARRYAWLKGGTDEKPGHRKKDGSRVSVDTHRNMLAECKTFFAWCVEKKYTPGNPLAEVEGTGKRNHGKPQLRVTEARKWGAKALELAEAGDGGALAAMLTLYLNLRASEITGLEVRDVDDGGALLWVGKSKTDAGRRSLEVPEFLRPLLLTEAKGRAADALLFGEHWRDWPRENVQRICRLAKVPPVTAHGMRGLHATLAAAAGITSHAIAAAMGHTSFAVTAESYAKPEAVEAATRDRALRVLKGGK